jgi:hypothetical protein
MNNCFKALLIVTLSVFALTCEDSSSSASKYAGTWELEFSGDFFGPAFIKINRDGSVNENNLVLALTADCGNLYSNTITCNIRDDGSIANGIIINNSSKEEVGTFTGTLTDTAGSGTYGVLAQSGTWTAAKE